MDDTYRFLNLPSYLPDFTSKCRFRDSDERNLFWFYEPPLMLSTGANSFTDSGLSSDILVPTLESLKCFRELNMIPNQNLNRIWPRYWPWNDLQLIINISTDECRKSNSGPFNTKGLENSILSLTRYETVAYLFQIGQKSKSKKNWFDFLSETVVKIALSWISSGMKWFWEDFYEYIVWFWVKWGKFW